MSRRTPELRLRDIEKAIQNIQRYAADDPEMKDVTLDAIVLQLMIVGEAIKDLPESVTDLAPEAPWSIAAKMRDALIHRYFAIDRLVIAETVERDIPELEEVVKRLLDQMEGS